MKQVFFVFYIFYSVLVQASFLPSIFADRSIAQRVDQQRHLEQQWFYFQQENPLIVLCVRQMICKQNSDVWRELKQSLATTNSFEDRNKVLDAMTAWIVKSSDRSKSCHDLNRFMKQQEDKKMWLVRHCSYCPEYQKKVIRNIHEFESFKTCHLDVHLNNKKNGIVKRKK